MFRIILAAFCLMPFIIQAQEKVGINTTNPQFNLDVRGISDQDHGGELQLGTPNQTNYLRFFGGRLGDRNPFIAFHDQDTFHLVTTLPDWSTFTRRLSMLPNGKIGVGTESPLSQFHIQSNSGLSSPQIRLTEIGNDYARLKMENDQNPGVYWDIAGLTDSTMIGSKINFYYNGPEGIGNRMTILGNGNVGIGTSSPGSRLDIKGGSWNLEGGSTGDLRIGTPSFNLRFGVATGGGGAGIGRIFTGAGVNRLIFGTNDSRRMVIHDNGNTGIGLDNPQAKLHINGDFRVNDLAGTGDRNVIVDSNGKFKIGSVGEGDTDWNESSSHVSTPKIARLITSSTSGIFTTYNYLDMNSTGMNQWWSINTGAPLGATMNMQNDSDGHIHMVHGGGKVGIGGTPDSKLTVEGGENNGSVAAFEVRTSAFGSRIIMDNNEIDIVDTGQPLFLNANSGNPICIGSFNQATGYKLAVDGKVIAEEMRVQLEADWPDYVFEDTYALSPLSVVEKHIKTEGHLPGIPKAEKVEKEGIALGEMQRKMMEKIEELTLYIIELDKKNAALEKRISEIQSDQK